MHQELVCLVAYGHIYIPMTAFFDLGQFIYVNVLILSDHKDLVSLWKAKRRTTMETQIYFTHAKILYNLLQKNKPSKKKPKSFKILLL
jgi:hypothetical protein